MTWSSLPFPVAGVSSRSREMFLQLETPATTIPTTRWHFLSSIFLSASFGIEGPMWLLIRTQKPIPGGTKVEQGMPKSEVKHFIIRYSLRNASDNMLVDSRIDGPEWRRLLQELSHAPAARISIH
jgi:hypothetical protein